MQIEWGRLAVALTILALACWALWRAAVKPGPWKEDEWPFGEDPRKH